VHVLSSLCILNERKENLDPQVATFTVFFLSFTGVVGKELMEISDKPKQVDRTILSDYKPPPPKPARPAFPVPLVPDNWGASERWGQEIIDFQSRSQTNETSIIDEENDSGKEASNEPIVNEEISDVNVGVDLSIALKDSEEENEDADTLEQNSPDDGSERSTEMDSIPTQQKDKGESDSGTANTDDSTNLSTSSGNSDLDQNEATDTRATETSNKEESLDSNTVKSKENDEDSPSENSLKNEENQVNLEDNETTAENKVPRTRFRDALSVLEIEEARETARAQLGLAFEILGILKKRGLKADPESYQCLIDASGRCGDTERATKLLSLMHEDGIVADGVVYSCLVSAFSAENAWQKLTGKSTEELPGKLQQFDLHHSHVK